MMRVYLKALVPVWGIWWALKKKDDMVAKIYLVWANLTLSVGMITIIYLLKYIKP